MKALKILGLIVALAVSFVHMTTCPAQVSPSVAIRRVLEDQAAAWNAGDIPTFMRAYKNSPDTTFIGKSVEHGYEPILERYKKAYATKDAMGTLDYSEITVRELDAKYAIVTGKFHLARTVGGGGDVGGIFSLVWEKTAEEWKIILDHTSVTMPSTP